MAKALVSNYGMSSLGYRVFTYSEDGLNKNYSESTDILIDKEVKAIIDQCAERTREIISNHKEDLEKIAEALLSKETIDILDIINLIGTRPFKFPKSMQSYIEETKARKERLKKEMEEREEEERKKQSEKKEEPLDIDANKKI